MKKRAKIITVSVIKGGTGKTTTAAALAQAAASDGRRVLAVDLDPQGNLSMFLDADTAHAGSFALLNGADPSETIQTTSQGIDVIAASPDLTTERTKTGSAMRLKAGLDSIQAAKKYDLILIDTPPQMGELTFNALQASTGLLIPLEADTSSLQGLYQIAEIAHGMTESNPSLTVTGIVLTRYDARPNLNRYFRDVIAEKGAAVGAPLLMEIRPGIALREAQAMRQSVYDYAPNSNPAQDYMKLYQMITEE